MLAAAVQEDLNNLSYPYDNASGEGVSMQSTSFYAMISAIIIMFTTLILPSAAQVDMSENAIQLKTLYEQLQGFKDNPEFHDVGFGSCCRFHEWVEQVMELQEKSGPSLLLEVGVLPGDLFNLGQEYMMSKGQPTSYTQNMEPVFKKGLYK